MVFTSADFQSAAYDARVCPVTNVAMRREGTNRTLEFTWNDTTAVAPREGFKNRFGQDIPGLLDLTGRDGQPCDAVEILPDRRPAATIGRPATGADANPPGLLCVGICLVAANGAVVPQALSFPGLPADALSLEAAGPHAWTLKLRCEPEGPSLGVSMPVTDNTEFKPAATPLFWLTGQERMGFVQLGEWNGGMLCRIGYYSDTGG